VPLPATSTATPASPPWLRRTKGESLAVQRRQIDGYAKIHGLAVAQVFVERGVSGSNPLGERPEGAALLAVLKPADVVITPKLDRMFRSALDALDVLGKLKSVGVALHMIYLGGDTTGNGVSKLVITILSAVAEAERERTRERVTGVKRDQRTRGRYLGGTRGAVAETGPLAPGHRGRHAGRRGADQPHGGQTRLGSGNTGARRWLTQWRPSLGAACSRCSGGC